MGETWELNRGIKKVRRRQNQNHTIRRRMINNRAWGNEEEQEHADIEELKHNMDLPCIFSLILLRLMCTPPIPVVPLVHPS